jgi:hypothetical protein
MQQVLMAEDPTNLCIDKNAREGRESFLTVLIPIPDNIMSYMRVSSYLPCLAMLCSDPVVFSQFADVLVFLLLSVPIGRFTCCVSGNHIFPGRGRRDTS